MTITQPFDLLNFSLEEKITISLKGHKSISGKLVGFDQHLNMLLMDAEEISTSNGEFSKRYSSLFVRGDNVIFVNFSSLINNKV
jgi:small nuclear ribonucleoprotein